jgi:hypothetical protein
VESGSLLLELVTKRRLVANFLELGKQRRQGVMLSDTTMGA